MSGLLSAIKVLRKREHARNSLWAFANQTALRRIPNRVEAPHHKLLCEYLQRLADDPDGGILIVLMPPGSAKSLFAGRLLPAWAMGRERNTEIVMVTNSLPLAETNGRAVRELLQLKSYQHIFNGVGLSPVTAAVTSFNSTNGSSFFGVGAAGAVLGRRGSWVLIDDPISGIEEAQSATQLAKLHDAFENNILTRLVPGAKVVLICQRLARNDLAGYLIDRAGRVQGGRKTTVLRLPMLCDDPDNDPMGRVEGEPLWPQYYTPGMLADAQANDLSWRTLYQQKPPSDEGSWCSGQDLVLSDRPSRETVRGDDWNIYIGCDFAHTVDGGDMTVFAVLAFNKRNGAMHFMDVYRKQVDGAESTAALLGLIEDWNPVWVGVDDDLGSKSVVGHLKTQAVYQGKAGLIGCVELMPMRGKSKEMRATALRAKIKQGLVHLDRTAEWAREVLREFLLFPHGMGSAVDDIVDAVGLIARKTSLMVAHAQETNRVGNDGRGALGAVIGRGVGPNAVYQTRATMDELWEDHDSRSGSYGRGKRVS